MPEMRIFPNLRPVTFDKMSFLSKVSSLQEYFCQVVRLMRELAAHSRAVGSTPNAMENHVAEIGVERLRQTASRTTTTMHVTIVQTQDMVMLARSKAISAKKIELSTIIGKIAPVIQFAGIEGISPLSVSFLYIQPYLI
jgi:hypothetical protein